MNSYAVYTYGGGDALYEVFNAIATLMGGNDYLTLIRLFGVLALFWVIIEMGALQRGVNWHWFVMFMLMFNICFVPKENVTIIDRLNPGATRVVANVPFGLAGPAWLFSMVGDGLTSMAESVFTPPNDMMYQKTGMVFGSKLVLAINNARFDDPLLNQNLTMYAKQCVYFNIAYGFYSVKDVYTSNDLMGLLLSTTNNSSTRGMYYDDGAGNQVFKTCKEAAGQLKADITPVVDGMIGRYANAIFANSSEPVAQRRGHLLAALPAAYAYLGAITTSASQMVTQAAMANYFTNSYGQVAAMAGADAAATAWSVAVAEKQQRNTYRTMGAIAARALPMMQTVFQVLIYAAFFMVFLALLLPITVSGKALLTYIKMLVWIELWPVLYAMLNMVVSVYAKANTQGVLDTSLGLTSMAGLQGMVDVNSDIAIIAGYLALSIPLMAWGLVTAGGFAFSQLAQQMFMPATQASSQASGETARGNIGTGNLQAGNQSLMQQQTSPNMNLGAQYSDGAFTQHIGPDGRVASQMINSDLGVGVASRESLMHNVSTARGHAEQVEQQHSQSVSEAHSAQSTAAEQFVQSARHGTDSNMRQEVSNIVGDSQSFQSSMDIAHSFGKEHGLTDSQSARVLANASANMSGGFEVFGNGGKINAGAAVEGISESRLQDAYKDAMTGKTAEAWSNSQQVENRLADVASRGSSDANVNDASRSLSDAHTNLNQEQEQWSTAQRKTEDLRNAEEFASSHSRDIQTTANDYLERFAASRGINVHDTAKRGEIERLGVSTEFSEFVMQKSGMNVDINGDDKIGGWNTEIEAAARKSVQRPVSDPTEGASGAQQASGLVPGTEHGSPDIEAVMAAGVARAAGNAAAVEEGGARANSEVSKVQGDVEGQSTFVAGRAWGNTVENVKDMLPETVGGLIKGMNDSGIPVTQTDMHGTHKVHGTPGTLGGEDPGFTKVADEQKGGDEKDTIGDGKK